MKSPSNYSFATVPRVEIPRSSFKRDRSYKSCFDSGYLIPFFSDEVYPGDTFNVRTTAFARLSTPIVPFMDNLYLDFFFFYVPYRLLWSNWNKMLGEQDNPGDSTDYLTPILCTGTSNAKDHNVKAISVGSLFDYLGFPVGTFGTSDAGSTTTTDGLEINAFLPRAYNKIWNDHFRDENLQNSVPENKDDGPDLLSDYTILKRGKRKDYFTSALPWPQKGAGAQVSIGGTAPVFGDGNALALSRGGNITIGQWLGNPGASNNGDLGVCRVSGSGAPAPMPLGSTTLQLQTTVANTAFGVPTKSMIENIEQYGGTTGLLADLSNVMPISINDMRMAFQLQRLMEKDARGGTRAPEIILTHFGVVCPDFRLQRSEFLGGGEIPMQVHQVVQNSSTDSTSPQGNMAAYGLATGRVGFSKSFVEHGVVLGLVSVRCDLNYQQGLHRSWSRRSKYDYYWPSLAHLGEQAVLNKEIFATGNLTQDNAAFGYQERWAELRYGVNQITGKLRSGVSGSLDVWHLAQSFASLPTLNSTFIEDAPPLDRVLAVQGEPQIIFDSLTTCNCVRPLPTYSVPGLIDHM